MFKIGNIIIENKIVSAPLAGFTTLPYRILAKKFGAGLVYAEMVSDKALVYKNEITYKMLRIDNSEHPVAMQLFGGDLDSMVEAAKIIDKYCDCDIIDINMGCPIPKVLKAGGGSKWLLDPLKSYEIVKTIVENVSKPVTCKIRIGWDSKSINGVEYAKLMEKAGVKAIAVHGRTKSQMYEGKANWEYIKLIKDSLSIPVIGNGDILSAEDALRMLKETGCDAIMIGRGALGNPFIFEQAKALIEDNKIIPLPDLDRRIEVCLSFAKDLVNYYENEEMAIKEMRSHTCWYIKGFPYSNLVKSKIHACTKYQELVNILTDYLKMVKNV